MKSLAILLLAANVLYFLWWQPREASRDRPVHSVQLADAGELRLLTEVGGRSLFDDAPADEAPGLADAHSPDPAEAAGSAPTTPIAEPPVAISPASADRSLPEPGTLAEGPSIVEDEAPPADVPSARVDLSSPGGLESAPPVAVAETSVTEAPAPETFASVRGFSAPAEDPAAVEIAAASIVDTTASAAPAAAPAPLLEQTPPPPIMRPAESATPIAAAPEVSADRLPDGAGQASPDESDPGPSTTTSLALTSPPTCMTLGPFDEDADLGELIETLPEGTTAVEEHLADGRKLVAYWVLIAPLESASATRRLANRLLADGAQDLWMFPDGEYQGYVSMGLYTRKSNASRRIRQLQEKGYEAYLEPRYRVVPQRWLDLTLDAGVLLPQVSVALLRDLGAEASMTEKECQKPVGL